MQEKGGAEAVKKDILDLCLTSLRNEKPQAFSATLLDFGSGQAMLMITPASAKALAVMTKGIAETCPGVEFRLAEFPGIRFEAGRFQPSIVVNEKSIAFEFTPAEKPSKDDEGSLARRIIFEDVKEFVHAVEKAKRVEG